MYSCMWSRTWSGCVVPVTWELGHQLQAPSFPRRWQGHNHKPATSKPHFLAAQSTPFAVMWHLPIWKSVFLPLTILSHLWPRRFWISSSSLPTVKSSSWALNHPHLMKYMVHFEWPHQVVKSKLQQIFQFSLLWNLTVGSVLYFPFKQSVSNSTQ
jgi:hypothetical protein